MGPDEVHTRVVPALNALNIGLGIVVFLATWLAARAFYNLFLHPLRKFPGPLANRASSLPFALRWVGGKQPFLTRRLHDAYGPVVRLGPNHLSFTDPRAFRDIYGHRVGAEARKGEFGRAPTFLDQVPGTPTSIISAPRDEHTALRRSLAHGFSDASLRSQEGLVTRYVDLLVRRLTEASAGGSTPLPMDAWFNWTTFDIMGDLIFGMSFGCLEERRDHPYIQSVLGGIRASSRYMAMKYVGLKSLPAFLHRRGWLNTTPKGTHLAAEMLQHRLSMDKERDDLFEGLVQKKDKMGLTVGHLAANAWVLVIAGSETTATTLGGTTYLLLTHPEALAKVTAEVRGAFKTAAEISIASASRLTYMLAVLNESLRMYPPVAQGLVRMVPPGEGEMVAGHHVPAGTFVEVPQWAANHSEQNWADPWTFRPERFLNSPEEALKAGDHLDALNPFSVGPRNCIGRNLAYAEMRLILARLLFEFDMELVAPRRADWIDRQKSYALWEKTLPLEVRLTPAGSAKGQ